MHLLANKWTYSRNKSTYWRNKSTHSKLKNKIKKISSKKIATVQLSVRAKGGDRACSRHADGAPCALFREGVAVLRVDLRTRTRILARAGSKSVSWTDYQPLGPFGMCAAWLEQSSSNADPDLKMQEIAEITSN